MTTCPPPERLRAYADRSLPIDERRDVARHVQACTRCEHFLQGATSPPGHDHTPVSLLADPTPWPPPQNDEDRPLELAGYKLGGEHRKGGMGAVYFGHDETLHRAVAVKVLLRRHAHDPESVKRFEYEARVNAQLQHPNIVPVHDVGKLADGRRFFVMPHVKGKNLRELLEDRPTPADDLMLYLAHFQKVCAAMAYAHSKGVIHRDLKPENVMVGRFGEVLVMDWGLAKYLSDPDLPAASGAFLGAEGDTHDGKALGTLAYMPPEQAAGEKDRAGKYSDVFSLGGILCAILTGAPPYRAPSWPLLLAMARRTDLTDAHERLDGCGADAELVALAKRCLSPGAAARPADAAAVSQAVTAYLAGVERRRHEAEVEQKAAAVALAESRKRRRVLATLWAVSLVAALFAVALLALTASKAGDRVRIAEEKAQREESEREAAEQRARRQDLEQELERVAAAADKKRREEDHKRAIQEKEKEIEDKKRKLRAQEDRAKEWQAWASVIGRTRALNTPFAQARAAVLTEFLRSKEREQEKVTDEQLPVVRAELLYLTQDAWGPLPDAPAWGVERLPQAFGDVAHLPRLDLLLALNRQRRDKEPELVAWQTQKGHVADFSTLLGGDKGDLAGYRVVASSDGDHFVLVTPAGDLIFCSTKPKLWNRQEAPHGGWSEGMRLAWEPKGTWAVSVARDGLVRFWKPEGEVRLWKPEGEEARRFLDFAKELGILDRKKIESLGLCVLADGEAVLFVNERLPSDSSARTHVLRFDPARGVLGRTKNFASLTRHELASLTAAPLGRRLAWADEAGAVTLWQADDSRPSSAESLPAVPTLNPELRQAKTGGGGGEGPSVSLAFSPDGERLAAARPDGGVHLLDVVAAVGKRVASFLSQTTGKGDLPRVFFDGNGDVLVVGPASGSVRRWAPRSLLRPVDGWPKNLPRARRVAASLEGDEWAMLTENGSIIRLDQQGRQRGDAKGLLGKETPAALAYLSEKRLLVQAEDGSLHLCEAGREPEEVFAPRHRRGALWSGHDWPLAVSPKGDVAAFCDPAGRVALYRPTEPEPEYLPPLLTNGDRHPVLRLELTENVAPLQAPMKGRPGAMAFDPDGKRLAVLTQDGVVWVFDLLSREKAPPHRFATGVRWATALCWSPGGQELAVGDRRDHASVWHAEGARAARCCAVVGPSLAFPAGRRYLTFDGDRVHVLEPGREIALASFTPLPPRSQPTKPDAHGLGHAMALGKGRERLLVARVGEPPVLLDLKGALDLLDDLGRLRREAESLIRVRLQNNNEFVASDEEGR